MSCIIPNLKKTIKEIRLFAALAAPTQNDFIDTKDEQTLIKESLSNYMEAINSINLFPVISKPGISDTIKSFINYSHEELVANESLYNLAKTTLDNYINDLIQQAEESTGDEDEDDSKAQGGTHSEQKHTPDGSETLTIEDYAEGTMLFEDLTLTQAGDFTEHMFAGQSALTQLFFKWLNRQMFKTLVFDPNTGIVVFEDDTEELGKKVNTFIEETKKSIRNIDEELRKKFEFFLEANADSQEIAKYTGDLINQKDQLFNTESELHKFFSYMFAKSPKSAINVFANNYAVFSKEGIRIKQHINTRQEAMQDFEKIDPMDNVPKMFQRLVEQVYGSQFKTLSYDANIVAVTQLVRPFMTFSTNDTNTELSNVMYRLLYDATSEMKEKLNEFKYLIPTLKALYHGLFRTKEQLDSIKTQDLEKEQWRLDKSSFYEALDRIVDIEPFKKEELRNISNAFLKMYPINSVYVGIKDNVYTAETKATNAQKRNELTVNLPEYLFDFGNQLKNGMDAKLNKGTLYEDKTITPIADDTDLNAYFNQMLNEKSNALLLLANIINGNPLYEKEFDDFYNNIQQLSRSDKHILAGTLQKAYEIAKDTKGSFSEIEESEKSSLKRANDILVPVAQAILENVSKVNSSSLGITGSLTADIDLHNQQHSLIVKLQNIKNHIASGKPSVFSKNPLLTNPNLFRGFQLKEGLKGSEGIAEYDRLNLQETFLLNYQLWLDRKQKANEISVPYGSFSDKSRAYNVVIANDTELNQQVDEYLQDYYTEMVNVILDKFSKVLDVQYVSSETGAADTLLKIKFLNERLELLDRDGLMSAIAEYNEVTDPFNPIRFVEGVDFEEGEQGLRLKPSFISEVEDALSGQLKAKALEAFESNLMNTFGNSLDSLNGQPLIKKGEIQEELLNYFNDFFNAYIITSHLLQGVGTQYKSNSLEAQFIDNVKRNVSVLSNYTPYIPTKKGTAPKSYVMVVQDIPREVESIHGNTDTKDTFDGAGFILPNKAMLNQVSTGGAREGTPIGSNAAQKPFGTHTDLETGALTLMKYAIFTVSNERIVNSYTEDLSLEDIINTQLTDCYL